MNLAHFSFGHTGPFPPSFLARKSRFGLGLLALVFATPVMRAPPTDGTVVGGTATITTGQNTTTITAGNNSVLRWGSFDVGSAEVVQFIQPGADARVLNWIGGRTPSQIDGSLLANGQVYLVNPAGVYFGQTAVVDVGRLYAIGGSLSREDFLAGLNRFSSLTGDVRNDGTLRGSSVALVGRTVLNTGSIVAPGGFVALAAGEQVVLGQNGSSIFVDAGHTTSGAAPQVTTTPGVANSGTIDAGGGSVVLAAGDLYAVAITHDGKLTARDVKLQGQGGATFWSAGPSMPPRPGPAKLAAMSRSRATASGCSPARRSTPPVRPVAARSSSAATCTGPTPTCATPPTRPSCPAPPSLLTPPRRATVARSSSGPTTPRATSATFQRAAARRPATAVSPKCRARSSLSFAVERTLVLWSVDRAPSCWIRGI